jgi:hypothetical protein
VDAVRANVPRIALDLIDAIYLADGRDRNS